MSSEDSGNSKTPSKTLSKTLGSLEDCDLVVAGDTVSPIHAQLILMREGFLNVLDAGSDHGTWLCRNGQWVRVMKAELGQNDRIRFGEVEVTLEQLLPLFGEEVRVQLRDSRMLRLPAALSERTAGGEERVLFERPRRNPETGNIEEDV